MRLALLLALVPAALSSATLDLPMIRPFPLFKLRLTWEGEASYYHQRFAGLPMKNGDPYHPEKATGAANDIPQGTMARVCREDRPWRCTTVEITDTGDLKGRLIDLSHSAARKLGMIDQGVVVVRVCRVEAL